MSQSQEVGVLVGRGWMTLRKENAYAARRTRRAAGPEGRNAALL
jgi:hypothetical protein